MPSSTSRPTRTRKSSSLSVNRTSTTALQKTQVTINVYDLLPPGRLSSFLWAIGSSLLHTGVVINDREYAYGGHAKRGLTGVYWTKPKFEPPGGTFRTDILQGFTFRTAKEIEGIIKEVSDQFLGRDYNLLTNNCNHFTSALCQRLTSRAAPAWLNRAASIGVALPCVVPREWISPPDHETADGELLEEDEEDEDEEEEEEDDERAAMLDRERRRRGRKRRDEEERNASVSEGSEAGLLGAAATKDSAGRDLPVAERAPVKKP